MFTGIVDHVGKIIDRQKSKNFKLIIKSQFKNFVLGESISVDGICLTVTDFNKNIFQVEISPETMRCTTAKTFKKPFLRLNVKRRRSFVMKRAQPFGRASRHI